MAEPLRDIAIVVNGIVSIYKPSVMESRFAAKVSASGASAFFNFFFCFFNLLALAVVLIRESGGILFLDK